LADFLLQTSHEAFVISFEYVTLETEQLQFEQKGSQIEQGELQTILRPSVTAPGAEIKLEEQNLSTDRGVSEIVELESEPQISYELSYSCLLIPRFPDHYLAGDITEDLPNWVRQICISYSWRLDEIMIRPGHLQWVMTVPLTVNPAQFMRIIRQLSSQKIFEYYPRYSRKNLSGQFWSPGFLVVPGKQLQSMEVISNFILQTRKQQGIY